MRTPGWLRTSWWMVAAWFLPALAYHVYESTVVRWHTGILGGAVSGHASDLNTIVLFFGALPLLFWITTAVVLTGARLLRRTGVPCFMWISVPVSIAAFAMSRVPNTAWESATMRIAGPGNIGATMLSQAVAGRDTARIASLLERGVKVDALDYSFCGIGCGCGETALMNASDVGDREIAAFLLAHGADPNAENTCGENALMRAIAAKSLPVVELLLAHGANAKATTHYEGPFRQRSALGIAEFIGDPAILRVLKAAASH